ncbi:hypothetical protein CTheo_8191 [Ceratobasidium theobromae]|uniref:Uncharacterized protein n=1 Tax=Ceratobasidium theobromae TaxID=1582974 RepID=A0A5N5Q9G2_9AGAM|nr:hypothetical protein CTheo_8191 [Ceratobasidium theobromae]
MPATSSTTLSPTPPVTSARHFRTCAQFQFHPRDHEQCKADQGVIRFCEKSRALLALELIDTTPIHSPISPNHCSNRQHPPPMTLDPSLIVINLDHLPSLPRGIAYPRHPLDSPNPGLSN